MECKQLKILIWTVCYGEKFSVTLHSTSGSRLSWVIWNCILVYVYYYMAGCCKIVLLLLIICGKHFIIFHCSMVWYVCVHFSWLCLLSLMWSLHLGASDLFCVYLKFSSLMLLQVSLLSSVLDSIYLLFEDIHIDCTWNSISYHTENTAHFH